MANNTISIKIDGDGELKKALSRFPLESAQYLTAAGKEAASTRILTTEGLKKYPPATEANQPPVPYYIRGRGTQIAKSRNLKNSERLGTHWYVKGIGAETHIGNAASYAKYVVGEKQAKFMAPKGWRKLKEVAEENIPEITRVYQAWVDKLLKKVGLR